MNKVKMAKAVSCQSRVIAYLPSLRALLQRLRAAPSAPTSLSSMVQPPHAFAIQKPSTETAVQPAVMTTRGNVFEPNPVLPMPGDRAYVAEVDQSVATCKSFSRHAAMESLTMPVNFEDDFKVHQNPVATSKSAVEFTIQQCPTFLRRSFMELFPDAPVLDQDFTVMMLSQRTQHDMTAWSPSVEKEREELLDHFFEVAKCVCGKLTASGYWADFVDPSCGRAFYGSYTNSTLFETDERFRYFGFEILDLGCCKCVSHHLWGAHAYVGAIFTNAPSNAQAVKELASMG